MHTKQGLSSVILVIIIAAVLLGSGYVAYRFSQPKLVCWPYCPGMTDQDREDIKKSALEIETADWKTYRNEKYGFEFRYPSEWHSRLYEVVQVSAPVSSSSFIVNSAGPTTSIIIHDDGRRRIDVGTNAVISGRKAIDGGWKVGVGNYISRIIIIDESPLSIDMGATSEKDKATEEQILSTFKFTK